MFSKQTIEGPQQIPGPARFEKLNRVLSYAYKPLGMG